MASRRSLYGLDWFAFFVADIQTGWGPFVAAYLTSLAWTQFDIGLILTIGTITLLALQIPAGAVVDRAPAKTPPRGRWGRFDQCQRPPACIVADLQCCGHSQNIACHRNRVAHTHTCRHKSRARRLRPLQ
jgi:hypothetical protein